MKTRDDVAREGIDTSHRHALSASGRSRTLHLNWTNVSHQSRLRRLIAVEDELLRALSLVRAVRVIESEAR